MSQEGRSPITNIVIFGQTGSGKSSLINMLAGKNVANASSAKFGVTISPESYNIPKGNKTYTFWDTCGLNEGEKGSVPAQDAANKLVELLKSMSVGLLIYFARGPRFLNEVHANKTMFDRIRSACGDKVPTVLVVTELEQWEDMDEWWMTYKKDVRGLKLPFKGYACVTTIKGRNNMYETKYEQSTNKVWELVEAHHDSSQNIIPSGRSGSRNSSHNIILFGASGAGKSSVVNMIVGQPVAEVSNGPVGCTFQHERYAAPIGDTHFNVYDTAGLNEGEQGRVPNWKAIHELYTLIRCLDGVSLLVYCIRGRITENARANWILFHKVLCATKVPIIAVETGLEHERDLDGRGAMLEKELKTYGMVANGVAGVVAVRGRRNEHEKQYILSQIRLQELITKSCRREPWSTTTDDWVGHIYKTTYTTKLCLFSDVQVELADEGNVVDEFIKETGMTADELAQLKSTLLDAETKLRKRR